MGPNIPPLHLVGIELIYTLIIIIFCGIIYFKTKEIYDLSKHKGIGFFRNTFLFFALSYLVRFLGQLFILYRSILHISMRRFIIKPHFVIFPLITYFSYVAILSLVFSSFRKTKRTNINWNLVIHLLAIISTFFVFLSGSAMILIGLQFALFIVAIVLINIKPKNKKNKSMFSSLHVTYYLLFFFWIINLFSFERGPTSFILNSLLNIFSIIIFYSITHRVIKRLSNVQKKG